MKQGHAFLSVLRHELVPGWENCQERPRQQISQIVVHRIEVSQEDITYTDTAADIARFFREHPIGQGATGGKMPYPILILSEGTIVQTVPLCRVTPHARSFNPASIGVACVGDFRSKPPSEAQRRSLVEVCATLCRTLSLPAEAICGHDELVGASHDPEKECPGRCLPLDTLRQEIVCRMESLPKARSNVFVWTADSMRSETRPKGPE